MDCGCQQTEREGEDVEHSSFYVLTLRTGTIHGAWDQRKRRSAYACYGTEHNRWLRKRHKVYANPVINTGYANSKHFRAAAERVMS